MKNKIQLLLFLFAAVLTPITFSSCNDDDDEPNNTAYYDFSIVWEVVDKGDLTTAEAMSLAADLTTECEDLLQGYTTDVAKNKFNELCEQLRYEFATELKGFTFTLRAKLVRNEGNVVISTKTFYIKPDGTILKKPAVQNAHAVKIKAAAKVAI